MTSDLPATCGVGVRCHRHAGNGLLWEGDSQIEKFTLRKFYDKARPRIEITIEQSTA